MRVLHRANEPLHRDQQEGFPFVGGIVELYKAGNSARAVANAFGISKSHVLRVVREAGIIRPQAVAQHLAAKQRRAAANNVNGSG